MTPDEFSAVCLLLEEAFKGEMPEARQGAYATFLMRYDGKEVMDALGRLVESGQVFTPTPGEIRAAMQSAAPPWELAWAQVTAALRRLGDGESAVLAELRETAGELVCGWVAMYGARRLAMEPVYDPDSGGAVLYRLRQSYADSMSTLEARRHLELRAGAALGELERGQRALGSGS